MTCNGHTQASSALITGSQEERKEKQSKERNVGGRDKQRQRQEVKKKNIKVCPQLCVSVILELYVSN